MVVKHKKRVKVFTGNFQFNFRAPTKKTVFCHPVDNILVKIEKFVLVEITN